MEKPLELILKEADARHSHAAGCKKAIEDCRVCKANIAWFGELPPHVLSQVLAERKKS